MRQHDPEVPQERGMTESCVFFASLLHRAQHHRSRPGATGSGPARGMTFLFFVRTYVCAFSAALEWSTAL